MRLIPRRTPRVQAPAGGNRRRIARVALRVGTLIGAALVLVVTGVTAASAAPVHELALASDMNQVLNNIRNWIMGILTALATVFASVGGVRYTMSGGDPAEVGKAKDAFKNAGLGYGLAALAPLVVSILKGIVGA